MDINIILGIVIIIVIIFFCSKLNKVKKEYTNKTKTGQVNEESFQRYAKFYGEQVEKDNDFDQKVNKIYTLIEINKKTDIREIAQKSSCSYEECILKIRYLKNKRQIGEYHIDHVNGKLLKCTEEENVLLKKYKPYIYNNHLSISEIAARLPGTTTQNLKDVREEVYQDLLLLYQNDLINGIKINEVDKEIIYYAIEKRKKEKDFVSLSCPNCGALNDVNRGSKVRCEYCDTIIEDKTI